MGLPKTRTPSREIVTQGGKVAGSKGAMDHASHFSGFSARPWLRRASMREADAEHTVELHHTKFTTCPIHSSPSPCPPSVRPWKQMLSILQSCIGTKFTTRFGSLMAELALDAVTTVAVEGNCHLPAFLQPCLALPNSPPPLPSSHPLPPLPQELALDAVTTVTVEELALDAVATMAVEVGGRKEIDIKQYAKVEKVPGGRIEDSTVLRGVMLNKDVVAPGKMRRRIKNPRMVLLESPFEYKKGE
ncbi:unnamed protein product [Closterium sp. Naga37s-1]|nr:unnamed protein product [Closterium sp. Naga37s-1]